MPTIVEVDTRTFLAHYIPSEDRVEISKYLPKELYDFCLTHELDHAEHSAYSPWHLWIDLRDRTKFFFNTTLLQQKDEFEKSLKPKTAKAFVFAVIYNLVGGVLQAFVMLFAKLLALPILLIKHIRKKSTIKKIEEWADAIWKCI